jgi:ABC-type multidrug transport system fused ATPase/permease subunit
MLGDDVDVRSYKLNDLLKGIAWCCAEHLFTGTIREICCGGNENATQAEIEAACKGCPGHQFIMSFPDGYDSSWVKAAQYFGGQKQRLNIAKRC